MVKTLYFLAIMLTAIALGAGLAHLFELPNKIGISAQDYLTVQRNYDNWWIVGLVVPLAFLAVLALTIALRSTGAPFVLTLIALLLLVAELAVFWGITAPVNRATENWTALPAPAKLRPPTSISRHWSPVRASSMTPARGRSAAAA